MGKDSWPVSKEGKKQAHGELDANCSLVIGMRGRREEREKEGKEKRGEEVRREGCVA